MVQSSCSHATLRRGNNAAQMRSGNPPARNLFANSLYDGISVDREPLVQCMHVFWLDNGRQRVARKFSVLWYQHSLPHDV